MPQHRAKQANQIVWSEIACLTVEEDDCLLSRRGRAEPGFVFGEQLLESIIVAGEMGRAELGDFGGDFGGRQMPDRGKAARVGNSHGGAGRREQVFEA